MAETMDNTPDGTTTTAGDEQQQFLSSFISEIIRSPVNIVLVVVIAILVYKIFRSQTRVEEPPVVYKELPKLRRDFTVEELKVYDGSNADGRICLAVNGNVYDVTKGKNFYGSG